LSKKGGPYRFSYRVLSTVERSQIKKHYLLSSIHSSDGEIAGKKKTPSPTKYFEILFIRNFSPQGLLGTGEPSLQLIAGEGCSIEAEKNKIPAF